MGRRKAQKNKFLKYVVFAIAIFYAAVMFYRANYKGSHVPLEEESNAKKTSTSLPQSPLLGP